MKKINIKFIKNKIQKKLHLPKYITPGSSALDLRACIKHPIKIHKNQTLLIPTGIAIHISNPNITGIILPRSGLGHFHGIILGNSIGILDSDYQGEIKLSMWNKNKKTFTIKPNSRIAQITFISIIRAKFNIVKSFKYKTKRNKQGFGHTGTI
ncbi:MAG: deoxyuridine triphosphatase [Candidatus Westeberhardia cardiocondylae]|nr:deoxyuridine triphosphatase [Candidatus Westeberhardia cardiocondylae]